MKEHSLLLSAPMVRAALAKKKTVTRRIPSMRNTLIDGVPWGKSKCKWSDINWSRKLLKDGNIIVTCTNNCDIAFHAITPIYQPGDVVWFKETWRHDDYCDIELCKDRECIIYRADYPDIAEETKGIIKWKTSLFLPRWASRLVRPVINSRIEYLQDITEDQAKAEGVEPKLFSQQDVEDMQISDCNPQIKELAKILGPGSFTAKFEYQILWDQLNGDRDGGIYSWKSNPLVIAIEFGKEKKIFLPI